MDRPSPELIHCPGCRAKNFAIDDLCATCREPLTVVILPRPKVRRIALATVMAMVAVFALCFAALRQSVVLGMAATVVLVPAALRSTLEYESRKADERPMGSRELARRAAESLTISLLLLPLVVTLFLMIGVPFFATIFPFHRPNAEFAWVVEACYGIIVLIGIAVSFYLAGKLSPRKD